jgi:hypothetical protein
VSTDRPITWRELLAQLSKCETEAEVQEIIDAEKQGGNRLRWLVRAQGRLRVLRNHRENMELGAEEA